MVAVLCLSIASAQTVPTSDIIPRLNGASLQGVREGAVVWNISLPTATKVPPPVVEGTTVWLATYSLLRQIDINNGIVLRRFDLPADILSVERIDNELQVEVQYPEGAREQLNIILPVARLESRIVYPPNRQVTGVLERMATTGLEFNPKKPKNLSKALGIWETRWIQDPTNPFIALFLGRTQLLMGQDLAAQTAFRQALQTKAPFFVYIRMAVLLEGWGLPQLSDQALELARRSWAELGYDPALPVSRAALSAYGGTLNMLQELIEQRRYIRADAWIRFLRDIAPRFQGYNSFYRQYAKLLEDQGRMGEASDWRNFERTLAQGSFYTLGPEALLIFRDAARFAVSSLLLVLLLSVLSMYIRYWGAQARDLRSVGGRYAGWLQNPLLRLRHVMLSYCTISEKLVLITLGMAILIGLSLWSWSARTQNYAQHPALNMGTYGGAWFYQAWSHLGSEITSPERAFVRGLAAQLDRDTDTARTSYQEANQIAATFNNLGVLESETNNPARAQEDYRKALSLDSSLLAPAYNLKLNPSGFEVNFQNSYRDGDLRLSYPSLQTVYRAISNPYTQDLGQLWSQPWFYLMNVPTGLKVWQQAAWVLVLLMTLAIQTLWLLVPRPDSAKLPPRPWLYRTVAVLVPGLGIIDEVWGLLIIVPWAGLMIALLGQGFGWQYGQFFVPIALGWSQNPLFWVLIALYLLNILALILEEVSFVRKQYRLTREQRSSI